MCKSCKYNEFILTFVSYLMYIAMNRIYRLHIALLFVFSACLLNSCISSLHEQNFNHETAVGNGADAADRVVSEETRKVLVLYSAGFNSLSSYLQEDIEDLKKGYLPYDHRNDDVLIVYSHVPKKNSSYSVKNSPVLFRLYKTRDGEMTADTLKVYDEASISASADHMREVLTFVKDEFPAKSYGMIFSSHANGYLPSGYYAASDKYEDGLFRVAERMSASVGPVPVPYVEPEYDESDPPVKSIGQTVSTSGTETVSYEMDIKDFADAIPVHMDYILFDACLMGGIEVAYELKDVCDVVVFSQAEVLAEGLNYTTLSGHLLENETPQLVEVCKDYFAQYDCLTGVMRSATISAVDCRKLEPLASTCRDLFSAYRDKIDYLNYKYVQRYYRSSYHWFYDLESILVQAGISQDELNALRRDLDGCVMYKANTPSFMNSFNIDVFSGFSMFLPSHGGNYLKSYYKTLGWNKATDLVL